MLEKWIHKPFPFITKGIEKWKISLGVGVFVIGFLCFLKPFNIDLYCDNVLYYAVIFGLISSLTLLFDLFIIPKIFPSLFNENKWNIIKMITFCLTLIITVAITNGLYVWLLTDNHRQDIFSHFSLVIYQTFLVGIFPVVAIIFFSERKLNKKHISKAKITATDNIITENEINDKEERLIFSSENKKETFTISNQDLLYISFDTNYVSIFYQSNGKTKSHLLRSTLKKIEAQHFQTPYLLRVHRSYLINLLKVKKITGNARGYSLLLKDSNINIPGSRSLSDKQLNKIKKHILNQN